MPLWAPGGRPKIVTNREGSVIGLPTLPMSEQASSDELANKRTLSTYDACRSFDGRVGLLREVPTEVMMRQCFNVLVASCGEIKVVNSCDRPWITMAEEHASGLAHGFDMRDAEVEYGRVCDRVRGRQIRLAPIQQSNNEGPRLREMRSCEHQATAVPTTPASSDRPEVTRPDVRGGPRLEWIAGMTTHPGDVSWGRLRSIATGALREGIRTCRDPV